MYSELLKKSAESAKNIVCMGLDPVIAQLPNEIRSMGAAGIPVFFEILFKEMQHRKLSPAAFKPNQGYYFTFAILQLNCILYICSLHELKVKL